MSRQIEIANETEDLISSELINGQAVDGIPQAGGDGFVWSVAQSVINLIGGDLWRGWQWAAKCGCLSCWGLGLFTSGEKATQSAEFSSKSHLGMSCKRASAEN